MVKTTPTHGQGLGLKMGALLVAPGGPIQARVLDCKDGLVTEEAGNDNHWDLLEPTSD